MQSKIKTLATVVIAICALYSNTHSQPMNITNLTINIQNNSDLPVDDRNLYPDVYTEKYKETTKPYD